jgi:hypothetical protein
MARDFRLTRVERDFVLWEGKRLRLWLPFGKTSDSEAALNILFAHGA